MPALTPDEMFNELCGKATKLVREQEKENIRQRLANVRNATFVFSPTWNIAVLALLNLDDPTYYPVNKPYILTWLNKFGF